MSELYSEEVIERDDILPCPICGGDVQMMQYHGNEFYLYCTRCKFTFLPQSTWSTKEVVDRFNRRIKGD